MVHKVQSKNELDSKIEGAGDKLVVIDFYATWCNPCTQIAPYLDELSKTYEKQVLFLKVDVDDLPDLVTEYKVDMMPTFIFLRRKEHLNTLTGANREKLFAILKENIKEEE